MLNEYVPTAQLRVLVRGDQRTLQQWWEKGLYRLSEPLETRGEWRDVPVVMDRPSGEPGA